MEGEEEDPFLGASDSTITPHIATISAWLLCGWTADQEKMDYQYVCQ